MLNLNLPEKDFSYKLNVTFPLDRKVLLCGRKKLAKTLSPFAVSHVIFGSCQHGAQLWLNRTTEARIRSWKTSTPESTFSPLWVITQCVLLLTFPGLPCTHASQAVIWQMNSLNYVNTFLRPHCRLRLGAFLLGCLFYVSSDCLFRLKKKICVDTFLAQINPKIE